MTTFLYAVVLTFPIVFGHQRVQVKTVGCETIWCTAQVLDQAMASPAVSRIQIWEQKDFAPLGQGAYVWPPWLDWWKS